MRRIIFSLLFGLMLPLCGMAMAADKPLVIESGQVKQLPSATTLQVQAPTTGNASINMPHGTAPTTPNNGDCWTTTAGLYCRINGATVGPYGTGSGAAGALTLISSVTTSGSQASVTFSSISGSYTHLMLVGEVQGTSTDGTNLFLQINGDTGANYDFVEHYARNNSIFNNGYTSSTNFTIAYVPGSGSGNHGLGFECKLHNYVGTTFNKTMKSSWAGISVISGILYDYNGTDGGEWLSTAAITSLKLSLNAGNFKDGSVISLYGIQ